MFYVYLLKSTETPNMYVGVTKDLRKRLAEHNAGQNDSTRPYMPWDVIFYEVYINKNDAYRREKYLKTTQGRRTLRLMLQCYFEDVLSSRFD